MKNRFISLFIFSFFFITVPLVSFGNSLYHIIHHTAHRFQIHHKIPGMVIEYLDHGKSEHITIGYAKLHNKKRISQNSIFEIGSLTKLFTAIFISEAALNQQLQLTDDATHHLNYLKYSNPVFNEITIQQLLTHTSGLPLQLPTTIHSTTEFQTYFSSWYTPFQPGSQWAYSDVGFGLAGQILEQIQHQNLNQIFQKQISHDFGMTPIGFIVPKEQQNRFVQGYDAKDSSTTPFCQTSCDDTATPASYLLGAKAMKASGEDMLKFLQHCLNLKSLPISVANAIKLTQTPVFQTPQFEQGLAWKITPLYNIHTKSFLKIPKFQLGPLPATVIAKQKQIWNANALMEKTGTTAGFCAYIALIPGKKTAVVILVNKHIPTRLITKLGRKILAEIVK